MRDPAPDAADFKVAALHMLVSWPLHLKYPPSVADVTPTELPLRPEPDDEGTIYKWGFPND